MPENTSGHGGVGCIYFRGNGCSRFGHLKWWIGKCRRITSYNVCYTKLLRLFAGAIDTVGGVILENIIKTIQPAGAVTCCGNVASYSLDLTVYPFILRGITLIGIDSQNYPMKDRIKVWNLLANEYKPVQPEDTCRELTLDRLQDQINLMLMGKAQGRTVLKLTE